MALKIKKECFKDLDLGIHNIKLRFNDGYAEGTFEVKDKITFTIFGTTFSATEDMTWGDWIVSYGIGAGSNGIVAVVQHQSKHQIHFYPDYQGWGSGKVTDIENALYKDGEVLQYLDSVIVNGGVYGREEGAPE